MKIEKTDEFPEDSDYQKKLAYTKSHTFEPGEFPSQRCINNHHSECKGFKRAWYGPVVTPTWPVNTFYDVPCDCSCHDDEHYHPRLRRLVGPRPMGEHKPGCFEPRGNYEELPRHC